MWSSFSLRQNFREYRNLFRDGEEGKRYNVSESTYHSVWHIIYSQLTQLYLDIIMWNAFLVFAKTNRFVWTHTLPSFNLIFFSNNLLQIEAIVSSWKWKTKDRSYSFRGHGCAGVVCGWMIHLGNDLIQWNHCRLLD